MSTGAAQLQSLSSAVSPIAVLVTSSSEICKLQRYTIAKGHYFHLTLLRPLFLPSIAQVGPIPQYAKSRISQYWLPVDHRNDYVSTDRIWLILLLVLEHHEVHASSNGQDH